MTKRVLFAELEEGFGALERERSGELTLRRQMLDFPTPLEMSPAEIAQLRTKLNMSRSAFAWRIRTGAKTIANWEQGRSKPNAQAAILLRLVDRHPQLIDEIATF